MSAPPPPPLLPPKARNVNSWCFDGTAPGIHLPPLSLGKQYLHPHLIEKFQSESTIAIPQEHVETIELALLYWLNAAGAIHTIELAPGEYPVAGEYLRLGHPYPITLHGAGIHQTHLMGGIHVFAGTTRVNIADMAITSQPAASLQIPRHGLLVDNTSTCCVTNCCFQNGGGSGVCARGDGTVVELKNVVVRGNRFSGLYAVDGGRIELQHSFEALGNGTRNPQVEASGAGSWISCTDLKSQQIVGNTVVEFDRCLGRNKSFVMPHTRERYGGRVE